MSKMEDLQLSETLQRYFSDVFLCCTEEKSENASVIKTIELIKSGNVPENVISQISELCWSHSATFITKRQFFSALKLVAAYQVKIPIQADLLTKSLELSLPKFTWDDLENNSEISELIDLKSEEGHDYLVQLDVNTTDSEVDSDTLGGVHNGSQGASSPASDSPTPTNSVQDRSWAVRGVWQGLVSEEQRQLLGTEEESSDRHSSEEDTEIGNEIWLINAEQREYYTNQFKTLQPDLNALIAGPIARMFFEKSRLPVHELRKIWQLADVTKDGALSLNEFNTAMHLVVLRRNHIELPDVLPSSLVPGNETPVSASPETEPILSPQTKETSKEWTKFIDSPTNSVSSPGPKPVNFDFQKVTLENDSKIVYPVALRLTPECSNLPAQSEDLVDSIDSHSPKKLMDVSNGSHRAIQRPPSKKISVVGPGAIPPPPSQSEDGPMSLPVFSVPKKEKPPPPPPRPFKSHGRSSSLDLNKLNKLGTPPTVPPRVSPNIHPSKKLINQRSEGDCDVSFNANFTEQESYENVYDDLERKMFPKFTEPRKHGAFEVYRNPNKSPVKVDNVAKWELFQKLQEENTVLLRICQELSQELADIREEKMMLKLRLEKQVNTR